MPAPCTELELGCLCGHVGPGEVHEEFGPTVVEEEPELAALGLVEESRAAAVAVGVEPALDGEGTVGQGEVLVIEGGTGSPVNPLAIL